MTDKVKDPGLLHYVLKKLTDPDFIRPGMNSLVITVFAPTEEVACALITSVGITCNPFGSVCYKGEYLPNVSLEFVQNTLGTDTPLGNCGVFSGTERYLILMDPDSYRAFMDNSLKHHVIYSMLHNLQYAAETLGCTKRQLCVPIP